MVLLIGILGVAGSGKDTVADYLVSNYNFAKISFADPIKRICKDVFSFTDEQLWGPSQERNKLDLRYKRSGDPEYLNQRYACQTLGTEWGRDCYQDVWIDYALRLYKKISKAPHKYDYDFKRGLYFNLGDPIDGVVIPDVRFSNELLAIKNAGGYIVKVKRDKAGLLGKASSHISEIEQQSITDDMVDYIIDNNSSLIILKERIINIYNEVLAK